MTDNLFTGWLPHAEDAVRLKFEAYADIAGLPTIPNEFGHEEYSPPIEFGMLGNNYYGDCVVAGGAHEQQIWARMAGKILTFNTQDVVRDYEAITGLPANPLTGADMKQAAAFRLKTGLLGADGQRHKIGAYLELKPGDLKQLYAAVYLFGAVGVGFRFYEAFKTQFVNHQAWQITSGMWGTPMGHYVPIVAVRGGNLVGVTWGRFQAIRPSVYVSCAQQVVACISKEALTNQKSPEGFSWSQLIADANVIARSA
jgi:hypothetical protein